MKTQKAVFYLLFIVLFTLPPELQAQNKEVPITASSKEALNLFVQGRDRLENSDFRTAQHFFQQAVEKDPSFAMGYLYLAQTSSGFDNFIKNLDKAVSLTSKISAGEKNQILYMKANSDGDGVKQKEYLGLLLKEYPSDKRIQLLAGFREYGNNNYAEALKYMKKASELDPNFAPAYNMIGYCQSGLNNYPEAEKAFQKYISLSENNANAYDSYAELLLTMGKYDESIAQYKKALEINPEFFSSMVGIGNNYVFKGDFNTARKYYGEYFDKATLVSDKLTALFWEAVAYVHEGNSGKAISVLDESSNLAEKENQKSRVINLATTQALIYSETGNPAKGMECYHKADNLIRESKFPESVNESFMTNSMLWNLYALIANNKLDEASAAVPKCRQKVESRKDPSEERYFNSLLGLLELKKGDYDKAISYFSKSNPESPSVQYYTGLAYQKLGDKQKASKMFEKIVKSNANGMSLALFRQKATHEL